MTFQLFFNHDFVVRVVPIREKKIHGYCDLDEDGRINIYLNESDPEEQQLKTLKHESLHCAFGDHYIPEILAEKRARILEKETRMRLLECGNR